MRELNGSIRIGGDSGLCGLCGAVVSPCTKPRSDPANKLAGKGHKGGPGVPQDPQSIGKAGGKNALLAVRPPLTMQTSL